MVSQSTKFEVSRFTSYEAVDGSAKCRNGVVWGGQGALKVIGNVTIRQSAYDFLFDFNKNLASILYRCRNLASYFSKVADFDPPHLHLAPLYGVMPVEFRGDLWRWAIVWCCLCDTILRLAVLVELRLVTDRQTDRQTQGHGQYRGCIASSGKNNIGEKIAECYMTWENKNNVCQCKIT